MCQTLLNLTLYCYKGTKTNISEMNSMGAGLTFVLIVLIICPTLFGLYMFLCEETKTRLFSNPKYEERIRELEKQVEELKEK